MLKDEWIKMAVVIAMERKAKELLPPHYYNELFADINSREFAFAVIDEGWYNRLCTIFITGLMEKEILKILRVAEFAGYNIRDDKKAP